MTSPVNIFLPLVLLLCAVPSGLSQSRAEKIYFVDGFHGGIYGHYPADTYTDYLSGLLEKYPQWSMCLEIEPETWDSVMVRTPGAYARFRKQAGSDRVEFTNPTYAQPYMYNISGESIIRQFTYGMSKTWEHFPDVEFTTYAVEEPCFTSALPQILTQLGFRYASLKCPNTCWGGYTSAYGGELVDWTGPDGTSILTSPRYACEELQEGSVWQTTAWGNKDDYITACRKSGIRNIVGMCYQDAGWTRGPWIGYGDKVRNGSEYVTWREYFEEKSSGASDDNWHFTQEDIHPGLMWGSQVLNRIARQVRKAENRMVQTEKAAAIAFLDNGYRCSQDALDEGWRTLMLAQHHDSWIVPYNRLNGHGSWADNITLWTRNSESICDSLLSGILASFQESEGNSCSGERGRRNGKGGSRWKDGTERYMVRVINTSGFPRHEAVSVMLPETVPDDQTCIKVTDAKGKSVRSYTDSIAGQRRLTFLASAPPFGYATYSLEEEKFPDADKLYGKYSPLRAAGASDTVCTEGNVTVENGMYRLVFDADHGGVIRSLSLLAPSLLRSKDISSLESASPAGPNRIIEFADSTSKYAIGELRGFFYDEGRFHSSTESPASVTVRDRGLIKTVEIRGEIASVPFTQTITLKEGDRKIGIGLRIDWIGDRGIGKYAQKDTYAANRRAFYDDRYKLNLMFPVFSGMATLYKDAPFDVCESRLEDTYYETWDSLKHNVVLHWLDLMEQDSDRGFAVLSDHTGSYSFGKGDPLCLTVQFSGHGLWGRHYGINGPEEMSFAIVPHTGDWQEAGIYRESLSWNEPLVCEMRQELELKDRSFIDTGTSGYEISAAYMTDEGLVVRLFNPSDTGKTETVRFGVPVKEIVRTDLNGNPTGKPETRKKNRSTIMEAELPPFGIRTYVLLPDAAKDFSFIDKK